MAARKTATEKTTTLTTEESVKTTKQETKTAENSLENEKIASKEKKTVKCTPCKALNIREEPNTSAKIIGEVLDGKAIECEEAIDGWCKYKNGYVMAKFLV